ncbi:MAG: cytochrome c family protein [Hyphomicrobiales bacterium]|nr:MAG: cytochrome c family protein [Hyphomicrobiales bacterium]
MDSFEWNKIFGAVLAAAFVVLGLNFLSDDLFGAHAPEKPGYKLAGAETSGDHGAKKKTAAVIESVDTMLAGADIAAGKKVAKKCAACHNFEAGSKNKVGPVLYDVVNRALGSVDGFGYSGAMKKFAEGKTWDYATLNSFLYKPKAYLKGTSMGFAGLKKTKDRAAIIAYLRSLSGSPAPLPGQ